MPPSLFLRLAVCVSFVSILGCDSNADGPRVPRSREAATKPDTPDSTPKTSGWGASTSLPRSTEILESAR